MKRRPVVFLDRDGTLIRDRPGHYLRRAKDMRLYPYAATALKLLRKAGYKLVVLTNQSGIGHGYLDLKELGRIHARLRRELKAAGASIDAIYFCVHTPEERCACRKPRPKLARRAIRELNLSLKGAAVIGDKRADVDLARALKITAIHLRTGHGRHQEEKYGRSLRADHTARNVLAAARWLLRGR